MPIPSSLGPEEAGGVAADGAAAAGSHAHPDGALLDLSGGPLCPPHLPIHHREAVRRHRRILLLLLFNFFWEGGAGYFMGDFRIIWR